MKPLRLVLAASVVAAVLAACDAAPPTEPPAKSHSLSAPPDTTTRGDQTMGSGG